MRIFRLMIDLPFLPKRTKYAFDDELGHVYRVGEDNELWEFPLRTGLGGYLWMLKTEGAKYLREVKDV